MRNPFKTLFSCVLGSFQTEKIIGRNVEVSRKLCDIRRRRIAFAFFPITDDPQTDFQIFGDGGLRKTSFFSKFDQPFSKNLHDIIIQEIVVFCKIFYDVFVRVRQL